MLYILYEDPELYAFYKKMPLPSVSNWIKACNKPQTSYQHPINNNKNLSPQLINTILLMYQRYLT